MPKTKRKSVDLGELRSNIRWNMSYIFICIVTLFISFKLFKKYIGTVLDSLPNWLPSAFIPSPDLNYWLEVADATYLFTSIFLWCAFLWNFWKLYCLLGIGTEVPEKYKKMSASK